MLEYMRKNANSTIVWFIIGAIAVVFIFFGVGGGGPVYKNITVNGEEVSPREYQNMMSMVSRSLNANFGGGAQVPEEVVRMTAVSNLVVNLLVRQFGQASGLAPTDSAVSRYIASIPDFQVDGRFNRVRYEKELAAVWQSPVSFEKDTREGLLNERLTMLVTGLARVHQPEMVEQFHFQEDRASFDYVFFPADKHLEGLAPTDENLSAYYDFNQDKWREPARMTVEYVELRPADFLDQVSVTDEELRDYYEETKDRFQQVESVDVSHILIQFPSFEPTEEERGQALAKAEAAYERAKNEDFAALAQEISDDAGSAVDGGELGSILRGMTLPEFEAVAFTSPIGEISRPFATGVGYHLVKVTGKTEEGHSPFEEVKSTLEGERKAFKARQLAVAKLEDLLVRTETNPKLSEAAASMGLTAQISQSFSAAEPLSFFENDQLEIQKAFQAPLNKIGPPVEKEDHLALYIPLTQTPARIPALDEVKEAVAEAWREDESLRLARVEAEEFITQAAQQGWTEAGQGLAADGSALFGQSELEARGRLAGRAPFEKADALGLVAAAYSVGRPGQVSPLPVTGVSTDGQRGVFVLAMNAFEPADEELLEGFGGRARSDILTRNKANNLFRVWRNALSQASIKKIVVPAEYTTANSQF